MLTQPENSCKLFSNHASVHFFHELTLEPGCLHLQHRSTVGVVLEDYIQRTKTVSQTRCQRIWTAFVFGKHK